MGAQNHIEKALREVHVILSQCKVYDKESHLVIVDKKVMIEALQELSQAVYEVMDEYELTKQSRDQAERDTRKRGDAIIADANRKAEDVYAGSVLYTNEALKRVQMIMQDTMGEVQNIYTKLQQDMEKELYQVKAHQTDLSGYLQDLSDTNKYLQIIEERNRKLAKERAEEKEEAPMPSYADVKPEIRINEAYFREHGISLEEEETIPEEKIEKVTAEVSVNLDSEYFKWKEREANGENVKDIKKPERKPLFSRFGK